MEQFLIGLQEMAAAKLFILTKALFAPILAVSLLFGGASLIPSNWILDVWLLEYDKEAEMVLFGRDIPFQSLEGRWYAQVVNQDRVAVCGFSDDDRSAGTGEFNIGSRDDDDEFPRSIPLQTWTQDYDCQLEPNQIYQLRGKWVVDTMFSQYTITKESEWFIINKK